MVQILKKNWHFLLILYFPFYVGVFHYLEKAEPGKIHILDISLDHAIPFLEVFVIPYLLWFLYLGFFGFYFLFLEKESFCRMMYFGMIGMTLFLLISWVYPNGLAIRPETFARDNVFTDLVKWLYSMDTATNVLPSIHVYNSIGMCFAIHESQRLKDRKHVKRAALVLTVLIVLSTMFIKQHSVVDVLSGLFLAFFVRELIYNRGMERVFGALSDFFSIRYRKKRVPRWTIDK